VSTKALNQAIRRNPDRFPADFCFQLTRTEREEVVTNCDHLGHLKFAPTLPWAFTEHGAIMAASVLRSTRAVQLSVYVVRAFMSCGRSSPLRQLLEVPSTSRRRIGFGA
jgi:hypothetical protein